MHQEFERGWWGDCTQTFGEEAKQLTYANRMGLRQAVVEGKWPVYDLAGKSVIDIGGGPVSMLLKTINGAALTVVDPCEYPDWVYQRYDTKGIAAYRQHAESFRQHDHAYDEAWIYNVLQHVQDPKKVIQTARWEAPVIRVFEWIETAPSIGHPHTLYAAKLDKWLHGEGTVEVVDENGAAGLAYHGIFIG